MQPRDFRGPAIIWKDGPHDGRCMKRRLTILTVVLVLAGATAWLARDWLVAQVYLRVLEWDGRVEGALEKAEGLRGWAPRISNFALLSLNDRSQGGMIIGVDPAREGSVTEFSRKLATGRFVAEGTTPGQRMTKGISRDSSYIQRLSYQPWSPR